MRFKPQIALGGLVLAVAIAACTSPATPAPGVFETVVAATVANGSTQIAQGFADTRSTLTAGAPTMTLTPPPTQTASNTPTPTETPTLKNTPTLTSPPPTITHTPPPPPTATPTPSPVLPGTYAQTGRCAQYRVVFQAFINVNWCVTSVVVKDTGNLEFNVSWTADYTLAADPRNEYGPNNLLMFSDANNYNMYLVDNLGNRYDHIATNGAAKLGGNIPKGQVSILTGVFVFPPSLPGAWLFTFHDDDQNVVIANVSLNPATP